MDMHNVGKLIFSYIFILSLIFTKKQTYNKMMNWFLYRIDKFKCKDGQCIASELLCDGQANCKDESDETYTECNKPEMATCPDYTFRCSYGACIDGDAICNGIKNCIDNSDETLPNCINSSVNASTSCAKNQFKCNNRQCIAKSNLCDGIADCTDNSDETIIQCGSIK